MKEEEKLIRSTVDKDDISLPEETMDDFLKDLEASYDRMKAREVIDESAIVTSDPLLWQKFKEMMDESTVVTGKISEVNKGGAVMEVEGVKAFIPASKLSIAYVEDTEPYLNKTVDAVIIDVDEEAKKLVLSVKDILIEKEKAEKKARREALRVGDVFEGTVASIKDYGAFVDIGYGIQGLLHISQISNERINNIRKVLKEGMTVKVAITKIQDDKISLSMKAANSALAVEKTEEEDGPREYSDNSQATTSLGDLLKNLKF